MSSWNRAGALQLDSYLAHDEEEEEDSQIVSSSGGDDYDDEGDDEYVEDYEPYEDRAAKRSKKDSRSRASSEDEGYVEQQEAYNVLETLNEYFDGRFSAECIAWALEQKDGSPEGAVRLLDRENGARTFHEIRHLMGNPRRSSRRARSLGTRRTSQYLHSTHPYYGEEQQEGQRGEEEDDDEDSSGVSAVFPPEPHEMRVAELKTRLRQLRLPLGGNKAALVARLQEALLVAPNMHSPWENGAPPASSSGEEDELWGSSAPPAPQKRQKKQAAPPALQQKQQQKQKQKADPSALQQKQQQKQKQNQKAAPPAHQPKQQQKQKQNAAPPAHQPKQQQKKQNRREVGESLPPPSMPVPVAQARRAPQSPAVHCTPPDPRISARAARARAALLRDSAAAPVRPFARRKSVVPQVEYPHAEYSSSGSSDAAEEEGSASSRSEWDVGWEDDEEEEVLPELLPAVFLPEEEEEGEAPREPQRDSSSQQQEQEPRVSYQHSWCLVLIAMRHGLATGRRGSPGGNRMKLQQVLREMPSPNSKRLSYPALAGSDPRELCAWYNQVLRFHVMDNLADCEKCKFTWLQELFQDGAKALVVREEDALEAASFEEEPAVVKRRPAKKSAPKKSAPKKRAPKRTAPKKGTSKKGAPKSTKQTPKKHAAKKRPPKKSSSARRARPKPTAASAPPAAQKRTGTGKVRLKVRGPPARLGAPPSVLPPVVKQERGAALPPAPSRRPRRGALLSEGGKALSGPQTLVAMQAVIRYILGARDFRRVTSRQVLAEVAQHYGEEPVRAYRRELVAFVKSAAQKLMDELPPGAELEEAQPEQQQQVGDFRGQQVEERRQVTEGAVQEEEEEEEEEEEGEDEAGAGGAENSGEDPLVGYVQCGECSRWRRLPGGTRQSDLPQVWRCSLHPEQAWASCSVPQEAFSDFEDVEEEDEIIEEEEEQVEEEEEEEEEEVVEEEEKEVEEEEEEERFRLGELVTVVYAGKPYEAKIISVLKSGNYTVLYRVDRMRETGVTAERISRRATPPPRKPGKKRKPSKSSRKRVRPTAPTKRRRSACNVCGQAGHRGPACPSRDTPQRCRAEEHSRWFPEVPATQPRSRFTHGSLECSWCTERRASADAMLDRRLAQGWRELIAVEPAERRSRLAPGVLSLHRAVQATRVLAHRVSADGSCLEFQIAWPGYPAQDTHWVQAEVSAVVIPALRDYCLSTEMPSPQ